MFHSDVLTRISEVHLFQKVKYRLPCSQTYLINCTQSIKNSVSLLKLHVMACFFKCQLLLYNTFITNKTDTAHGLSSSCMRCDIKTSLLKLQLQKQREMEGVAISGGHNFSKTLHYPFLTLLLISYFLSAY